MIQFEGFVLCRRGAFMQVKEALEGRFPGIEVTGGPYPVAPAKVTNGFDAKRSA